MELWRYKNNVFTAIIGIRLTTQGETKAQLFALGTRIDVAQERAKRIQKLWLDQPNGIWSLDAFRMAKQIAKGLVDELPLHTSPCHGLLGGGALRWSA